jgi:phage gp36-like protein
MNSWFDLDSKDDTAAVENKLKGLSGWSSPELVARLDQAQRGIMARIVNQFGATTVYAWTPLTVPPRLKDLCASVAAMNLKQDYLQDYKPSTIERDILDEIKGIADGSVGLFDSSGNLVASAGGADQVMVNTENKTKTFSSTNPTDTDAGKGTLDAFGV